MDSSFHEKSDIAVHTKWQQRCETSHKSEMIAIKLLMVKQLYLLKTGQKKSNKSGNRNENVSYTITGRILITMILIITM